MKAIDSLWPSGMIVDDCDKNVADKMVESGLLTKEYVTTENGIQERYCIPDLPQTQFCSKCGKTKPITDFYRCYVLLREKNPCKLCIRKKMRRNPYCDDPDPIKEHRKRNIWSLPHDPNETYWDIRARSIGHIEVSREAKDALDQFCKQTGRMKLEVASEIILKHLFRVSKKVIRDIKVDDLVVKN